MRSKIQTAPQSEFKRTAIIALTLLRKTSPASILAMLINRELWTLKSTYLEVPGEYCPFDVNGFATV